MKELRVVASSLLDTVRWLFDALRSGRFGSGASVSDNGVDSSGVRIGSISIIIGRSRVDDREIWCGECWISRSRTDNRWTHRWADGNSQSTSEAFVGTDIIRISNVARTARRKPELVMISALLSGM